MSRHRPDRPRVLAIHRYYWPDSPPYASMLRAIAARWACEGSSVRIVSSQPSYKPEAAIPRRPWRETLDGVGVERVRLLSETGSRLRKLLNFPLFVLAASWRALGVKRGDVVMCSTSPPVVLAAAVSLAARLKRAHFIYHCMDLHPEIGKLSGEFRNPLVFRLLRCVDRATCRRSTAVVVLSEDMRTVLLERDATLQDRIVVLNNFDLPEFGASPGEVANRVAKSRHSPRLRLVFTGNVGRFQGLDNLVAAVLDSAADLELVIMGEGKAKEGLQRLVAAHPRGGSRVEFRDYGTPAEARSLMRTADVGVVSLVPGIVRYAYPSKTMTYLAEGLPLLLLAETDSEIARTVREEAVGVSVGPGDPQGTEHALHTLAAMGSSEMASMRARARALAENSFGMDQALDRWVELLEDVIDGRVATV